MSTTLPMRTGEDPGSYPTLGVVGTSRTRVEGPGKVAGAVKYAADEPVPGVTYGVIVMSTISRGRIKTLDTSRALALPGVVGVIDYRNAPRLTAPTHAFGPDAGMLLLQDENIPYAGWPIAVVVAETQEQAQEAAESVVVTYDVETPDLNFSPDHPDASPAVMYFGEVANKGDVESELAASDVVVEGRYLQPEQHCVAMEPHSAVAWWEDGRLQAIDCNQGAFIVARVLATLFSYDPEQVRVVAEHVGGGFGSKGLCGPQLIFATMGATLFARPVRVTMSRSQVFLMTPPRPLTDQRVRLGADRDGTLRAIEHLATYSHSPLADYLENLTEMTNSMYAAPAIRSTLSKVPVDIVAPFSVRGPGMTPGSFALESAMDELAAALEMDPIEMRLRNEPQVGPVSGNPFSSRHLVACLEEGSRRFGWAHRDHRPRQRREGRLLVGTGVAAVAFGTGGLPTSCSITAEADGTYTVAQCVADIGTGARTAVLSVAADALGVGVDKVRLTMADSDLGMAWSAGGSRGMSSWAWGVTEAATQLKTLMATGELPVTATVDTSGLVFNLPAMERHTYSAVFSEVTVDEATGEVRVRRLLGMFAAGRIVNPLTARSQVVGGMIMGLSTALHEESVRDARSGRNINANLAGYHIAAHADVPDVEADFVADYEPGDPSGIKGVGEIGACGTAAAIANAVWHATGTRQRTLPIRLDRVLDPVDA
jgi:xanthine dehydrogenase YagR molybdenum-binding subunit